MVLVTDKKIEKYNLNDITGFKKAKIKLLNWAEHCNITNVQETTVLHRWIVELLCDRRD